MCEQKSRGISKIKSTGKYRLRLSIAGDVHCIGNYLTFDEALEAKEQCLKMIKDGTIDDYFENQQKEKRCKSFVKKYGEHRFKCVASFDGVAYPCGSFVTEEEAYKKAVEAYEAYGTLKWNKWYDKQITYDGYSLSKDNGIVKMNVNGFTYYYAKLVIRGKYYSLGYYKNKNEALKIRRVAVSIIQKKGIVAFNEWYKNLRKLKSPYPKGISYKETANIFIAQITINKKFYFLGNYSDVNSAIAMRKEAEKKAAEGEDAFIKWFNEKKQEK